MQNSGLLVYCSSLPKAQPDFLPSQFGVSKCLGAEVGNCRPCLTWRCSPALKAEGSPKPFNYFCPFTPSECLRRRKRLLLTCSCELDHRAAGAAWRRGDAKSKSFFMCNQHAGFCPASGNIGMQHTHFMAGIAHF